VDLDEPRRRVDGAAVDEVRSDLDTAHEGEHVGHGALALLRACAWGRFRGADGGRPKLPGVSGPPGRDHRLRGPFRLTTTYPEDNAESGVYGEKRPHCADIVCPIRSFRLAR
jgi:hypothetical protein